MYTDSISTQKFSDKIICKSVRFIQIGCWGFSAGARHKLIFHEMVCIGVYEVRSVGHMHAVAMHILNIER